MKKENKLTAMYAAALAQDAENRKRIMDITHRRIAEAKERIKQECADINTHNSTDLVNLLMEATGSSRFGALGWLKGNNIPTAFTQELIADALGMTPEELFSYD